MNRSRLRALPAGAALVALGTLAACTTTAAPEASAPGPAATAAGTTPGAPAATGAPPAAPIAITHLHAVARDPKTGELLLATHEGLFRHVDGQVRRTGPVIDLMGFAVGPDGTFYASGHPGTGTDLPQPVGLITSGDGGRTWRVASRGGESDFHALAVGPRSVTGFDGALRTTSDNRSWTTRTIASPPRALAASPTSGTLVATTAAGLLLSRDDGASWQPLAPPETAVLAAWADEQTIVIATTSGRLATSSDSGATWTRPGKSIGAAEALFAQRTSAGQLEVLAVVDGKVLRTTDAGATTEVLL